MLNLLVTVDNFVDEQVEEKILELARDIGRIVTISLRKFVRVSRDISARVIFLNEMTEQEKLCALVHLYCIIEKIALKRREIKLN